MEQPVVREESLCGGRIKRSWHVVTDASGTEVWHGNYKLWHQNDQLMEEGDYVWGKKCGVWTSWHDNGVKAQQGLMLDGVDHGEWKYWRRDGSLAEVGHWKLGKPHGVWEVHLKSGRILVGEWRDGERWDGECYTNGRYTKHVKAVLVCEGMLRQVFGIADEDEA